MYSESRQPVFKSLTPKEAEEFLAINNFPCQRKYNPLKGRGIADRMDSGEQRRLEVAVAKIKETGVSFLMNGQHTCQAVLIHGKPYPAVVAHYLCDTMEDAWRLFATFDVHATRTERQFMNGRRGLFTDDRLHDMHLAVLQSCGSALYALGAGTDPQFGGSDAVPCNKTAKADCVDKYADDVVFVNRYANHPHLIVVPCVAAIIATHRAAPLGAVVEFWDKVGSGEMLTNADPRKKLREALQFKSQHFSSMRGRDRNKAVFATCVAWWNAWRSGQPRKAVKLGSMLTMPKVLA
ncbi:MAG TPA: hypothetical protein DCY07_04270 [Rhodospirillaceae bacterium]|nr:hypothetical protein [Rhodospirillaceae bacterium]